MCSARFQRAKVEEESSFPTASHCTLSAKAPGSFVAMGCSLPGVELTGVVHERLKLSAVSGQASLERDAGRF